MHSDCVDPALAAEVLTTLRDVPDARGVLIGKAGAYVQRGQESAFAWIGAFVPPLTVVPDVAAAVDVLVERGDGVLSVGIVDDRSAEDNSLPALAHLSDRLSVMATHPTWVDVVSPTASKGRAVRMLQDDLGIGPDQTAVFGDFLNDLSMMGEATYAFAMANGHPRVKQRAWRTAPANNANGVVRTICALLDIDPRSAGMV